MSAEHARQVAADRILSEVREAVETALRTYAEEVVETATGDLRRQTTVELFQVRDALQRQELARIDAEAQLVEARRLLDDARRTAELDIAELRSAQETALAAERLRADAEIEDARRAAHARADDLQRTADVRLAELTRRVAESHHLAAHNRMLVDALRAIDEAGSLSGVLQRIVDSTRGIVDRAALLLVSDGEPRVWRSLGLDGDGGAEQLRRLGLDAGGLVARAVRERRVATGSGGLLDSTPPALGMPDGARRAAAAFPITVSGDVIAVLYADAPSDEAEPSPAWYHWMETVAIYAGRTLETLTVHLALGFGSSLVQPSHEAPGHRLSGG